MSTAHPALGLDTGPRATPLGNLFRRALDAARASGQPQTRALSGGAVLTVWVDDTPGLSRIGVRIRRANVSVGDLELKTFRKHFGVPEDAARIPEVGQSERVVDGVCWFSVVLMWRTIMEVGHDE